MKYILTWLLVLHVSICLSQKKNDLAKVFFHYGFGYHHQSLEGLNRRIANRPEYEKIGSNLFSINAGWNIERNHFLMDANFDFGNSLTGNADKRSSNVSLFSTALNIGYNLLNKQNIRFYPFVGLGYNTYLARLNKDVSAIPFDSVLQSSTVQQRTVPLTFTNGLFCYQAGLGIDFIKQRGRYNRSIGIRAGYSGSFSHETWRINETQLLQNAPSDKVSQFNISLLFSIGRSRNMRM